MKNSRANRVESQARLSSSEVQPRIDEANEEFSCKPSGEPSSLEFFRGAAEGRRSQ